MDLLEDEQLLYIVLGHVVSIFRISSTLLPNILWYDGCGWTEELAGAKDVRLALFDDW
jgi:hypothetical protein